MVLGVWVMFFLFLGVPQGWKEILAVITGILIIGVAYRLAPEKRVISSSHVPYVEHKMSKEDIGPKNENVSMNNNTSSTTL